MIAKQRGRRGEYYLRKILSKYFFVVTKGISTPGVDIIAIRKDIALFIEVKTSYKSEIRVHKRQIEELYRTADEFMQKVGIPARCYIIVKFPKGYKVVIPPRDLETKTLLIKEEGVLSRKELLEYLISKHIEDIK